MDLDNCTSHCSVPLEGATVGDSVSAKWTHQLLSSRPASSAISPLPHSSRDLAREKKARRRRLRPSVLLWRRTQPRPLFAPVNQLAARKRQGEHDLGLFAPTLHLFPSTTTKVKNLKARHDMTRQDKATVRFHQANHPRSRPQRIHPSIWTKKLAPPNSSIRHLPHRSNPAIHAVNSSALDRARTSVQDHPVPPWQN